MAFQEKTTSDAYITMLDHVFNDPEYESSPRGLKTREILNYTIKILEPSSKPIVTANGKRNEIIANYTTKEIEWYISGDTKGNFPAKFWHSICDENGEVNSNYGYLTLHEKSEGNPENEEDRKTPFDWAKSCLIQDADTRKAIVRFNKPRHAKSETKDFVCTLGMNFHIRENKLHASARMRSADLFTGPVYDIPWFSHLQELMLKELKEEKYPNLEMGTLTFSADSLHIYEKDFEKIEAMIK